MAKSRAKKSEPKPEVNVLGDEHPYVTWEQALKFLDIHGTRGKRRVHSMTGGMVMMGCDIDLDKVEANAKAYGISVAGPNMTSMGHGLAIIENGMAVFYATKDSAKSEMAKIANAWEAKEAEKKPKQKGRPKAK